MIGPVPGTYVLSTLSVCVHCHTMLAYDEPAGLESEAEFEQWLTAYQNALDRVASDQHLVAVMSEDEPDNHHTTPCAMCGDRLHGARYTVNVTGPSYWRDHARVCAAPSHTPSRAPTSADPG